MNESVGKRGRSIQEAKECMHDRIDCCSICNGADVLLVGVLCKYMKWLFSGSFLSLREFNQDKVARVRMEQ